MMPGTKRPRARGMSIASGGGRSARPRMAWVRARAAILLPWSISFTGSCICFSRIARSKCNNGLMSGDWRMSGPSNHSCRRCANSRFATNRTPSGRLVEALASQLKMNRKTILVANELKEVPLFDSLEDVNKEQVN